MVIEIVRRWSNEPVTILYLEGIAKLGESADFLMEALEHASKNTRLVVDWTKVDYIDSTGIGEIVRACIAVARKAGKRVFLSNPSERVSRLIEIAASADCFQIVVDEDEALAYLGLQSSVSLGNTLAPPSPTPISHSTRQRPLRVFLCHASNDKTRIRSFADELAVRGIDVWIDEKKLLPGDDWRLEIERALRITDCVIVFLSKSSTTKRGYVQKEIKAALDIADEQPEGSIFVIPARLDDCPVPDRLSRWQWVDVITDDGVARLLSALAKVAVRVGATTPL